MLNSQINVINLIDKLTKDSTSQSRFERKSKIHVGQSNFLRGTFNMIGFYKCYPDRKISSIYVFYLPPILGCYSKQARRKTVRRMRFVPSIF